MPLLELITLQNHHEEYYSITQVQVTCYKFKHTLAIMNASLLILKKQIRLNDAILFQELVRNYKICNLVYKLISGKSVFQHNWYIHINLCRRATDMNDRFCALSVSPFQISQHYGTAPRYNGQLPYYICILSLL